MNPCAWVMVGLLVSVEAPKQVTTNPAEQADLRAIGLAFHNYIQTEKRAPKEAKDLAPHLVGFDDHHQIVQRLKAGRVVLGYNVSVDEMPAGMAKTVLAYAKDVPTKGGYVLMADGKVVTMTVKEFTAATLVKSLKEEKLEGKWKMVSSERNGRGRPVKVTQVVIKADKITFVGPDEKASFDVSYKRDSTKTPKAIDVKNEKGDETTLGIYQLDGDTLKLCMAKAGAARPTEFTAREGSGQNLITLKREKP